MSSQNSTQMTRTNLANLSMDERYMVLGNTKPGDIPDFKSSTTFTVHGDTRVEAESCVGEMAEWLNDKINAGVSPASYKYNGYRSISTRTNIPPHAYQNSPHLPRPDGIDSIGASCILVSLTGTVEPRTQSKNPKPKTEPYQQLWNFISVFANSTGAEIKTQHSQTPKDSFSVYLFYNF